MKTIEEIYGEMKTQYEKLTGLAINDGGDMALRLYAVAAQLYSLWVHADFLDRQAFPQTAQGESLDYHAELRGLTRGAPTRAQGLIRFSLDAVSASPVIISEGTGCMTGAEVEFVTTETGTIPAGSLYCDVAAQAVLSGAGGNVPAESILFMELAPGGVAQCYNPAAFSGGSDAETDDELRARIVSSYRKLPNGANAAYYEASAMDIDGVEAVTVLPKRRGLGTVDIIIASADGVPTQSLIDAVDEKLQGQREICVDLLVLAPATVTVNVAAELETAAGYDYNQVANAVTAALTAHFTGKLLGEKVTLAKLGSIIYGVEGVKNYHITSPAADVSIAGDRLPRLGTITLNDGGA